MPIPPKPKYAAEWFDWFQTYDLPRIAKEHAEQKVEPSAPAVKDPFYPSQVDFFKILTDPNSMKKLMEDFQRDQFRKTLEDIERHNREDPDYGESED